MNLETSYRLWLVGPADPAIAERARGHKKSRRMAP